MRGMGMLVVMLVAVVLVIVLVVMLVIVVIRHVGEFVIDLDGRTGVDVSRSGVQTEMVFCLCLMKSLFGLLAHSLRLFPSFWRAFLGFKCKIFAHI